MPACEVSDHLIDILIDPDTAAAAQRIGDEMVAIVAGYKRAAGMLDRARDFRVEHAGVKVRASRRALDHRKAAHHRRIVAEGAAGKREICDRARGLNSV